MAFVSRGANNFIKRIYWHNCARPWYVYVETFVPAFIKAVITISILDFNDVVRMHGERLAAGRGRGPRRRKRHFTKVPVHMKETPTQRVFRRGLKTLLIITAPLEAIGFAWLLYSAADQFWMDWSMLLEQSDFCDQPIFSGPCSRERGEGQIGILSSGDIVPLPILTQNRAGWITNAFHVELPEGYHRAFFSLSIEGAGSPLNGVFLRFFINTSLGAFRRSGSPINIGVRERVDISVDADFFIPVGGAGSIAWEIVGPSVPAGLKCFQGNFVVWRYG